jgi:hypothetical protein
VPASTPVYGITYPCSGDTIDPAALAVFANSMDAALVQGAAELAQVTSRPNAEVSTFTPVQPVVINTATNLTYTVESYDNDNMADLAVNNDRLTVRTDGIYLVRGAFFTGSTTTQTSATVILTVNSLERGRFKTRPRSSQTNAQVSLCIPMSLVAGDIIRMQGLWTGSGGPSDFTTRILSASFIAAP